MNKIREFIEKHSLKYDWRGYKNKSFMVWIPFYLIEDFLKATSILKYMDYENLPNCGLCETTVAVDLTEAFYADEIREFFPQERRAASE